ncbi:MAG TPA: hypothetical protein VGF67_24605 [Ktedonobacteraceae bacterium]|jgi:hypothetical protein
MKMTVHNLGPLREAKVDVKPLTIFVGPNNTGKTWLAHTRASICGSPGLLSYLRNCKRESTKPIYFLEDVIQEALSTGDASFDLVGFADKYGGEYFNDVARSIAHDMYDFTGTGPFSFAEPGISVDLTERMDPFLRGALTISAREGNAGKLVDVRKKSGRRRMSVNISTQAVLPDEEALDKAVASGITYECAHDLITRGLSVLWGNG